MSVLLDFFLPSPPKNWDATKDMVIHKKLAKVICKEIEPAGIAFMGRVRRAKVKRTLAEDYQLTQALLEAEGGGEDDEEDEPESKRLLASDPSKWKTQDHYAVLGLSKKRYLANDEDIKRAYRRKVLKHHPDKKAHVGGNDNFFKCIQKAWEVLTDPKKRIQWDSCDPTFDEAIPNPKDTGDFYEMYGPVFERNARFSKSSEVAPPLGNENSTRAEVDAFYHFWLNFESWRTFEMRDEEDTEKAGSRDEKRWLDRKNFASRKKHKKEDSQRVNRLVTQAFELDPRVRKFKNEDKLARTSKKREREAAALAAEQEALRLAEEKRIAEEKAEAEAKEKAASAKLDKDAAKNAVKKERKTIRRLFRDNNSFLPEGAKADAVLKQTEKLESLLSNGDYSFLEDLRVKFEKSVSLGAVGLGKVLDTEAGKQ
ncbi:hypothetical protein BC833DRAFT_555216 [Globomyces pollinis-pini]|nr:hypothetical protein BC833DRAFT_555216 [Globomyces pollinis-pini]